MPRAYSLDLRERLLRALDAGLDAAEVERTLGVSLATQRRWRRRAADGTGLAPGRSPGRGRLIPAAEEEGLRAQVAAAPDATLAQHCAAWEAAGKAAVSESTMSRALRRVGVTRKKRP